MFILAHNATEWSPINTVINRTAAAHRTKKGSRPVKTETHSILTARVSEIEITPTAWMAATSAGLYTSTNQGKSWSGGPVMGKQDFVSVQSNGSLIALATRSSVLVSTDDGKSWQDRACLPT